ncbi:MAG: DUF58 domain-containing protein [Crocinitomicaceae bacterium]|nr:DUF58 domain-containing protein [Crocinitomicaceae bacterium]
MNTKELLKKVKTIEIRTRGLSKQVFSGNYHAAFKGKGMTFSEVKDYQFGDDVRNIDWNVTARFNDTYVKVFEEERELNVVLILDISGSQFFGSRGNSKRELLVEVAAILAFSAVANNDKVGAIFVSDKLEKYIPPKKGRSHAMVILRTLIDFQLAERPTKLSEGLRVLTAVTKKRCIAFILSDFIDRNDFLTPLKIASRKHDLVALQLTDTAEEYLPNIGLVELIDAESREKFWINTSSKAVQQNHRLQFLKRKKELKIEMQKCGVDIAELSTEGTYINELSYLFNRRRK